MNKLCLRSAVAGLGAATLTSVYHLYGIASDTAAIAYNKGAFQHLSENCTRILDERQTNSLSNFFSSYCAGSDSGCTLERLNTEELTDFCSNVTYVNDRFPEMLDDISTLSYCLLALTTITFVATACLGHQLYKQHKVKQD